MFDFLKKKKQLELIIGSPVKGKAVPLSSVNDPTFSEGMLGQGIAICPEDSKIYAPADGTIGMVFNTLHAVSLTTKEGVEILIHIGLDTVKMNGEGFKGYVKAGDTVKKGQILGIIEAMKLMNEIESDFDGKVAEIYVENGQAVEYGQPLFRIA